MPKVDHQGAKVRSAAVFVTFCAKKSSDAQQKTVKQSSHCWQQNSKAEESGALSTDNISLGELTGKTYQTEFSACNIPRGDNSLPG